MKKSILKSLIVLLLASSGSLLGHASEPRPADRPTPTESQIWLGAGIGSVFGFGSGQAVQNRWSEAGWPFTVVDGVAAVALLSTFGDCLSCSREANDTRDTIRAAGGGLFIASRIVQVGELVIYGIRNHGRAERSNQKKVAWALVPDPERAAAALVSAIRF